MRTENVQELERQRREILAQDIIVTRDGNTQFAVVDLDSRHIQDGSHPLPVVLYAGFRTREAAELAREDCINGMADPTHGNPYGPSEVTVEMWEELAADGECRAGVNFTGPDDRESIAARMTIEDNGDGLRVCERRSNWAGEFMPCRYWSPPMKSRRAAELAMREIINDLACGLDPEAECRKDDIFNYSERLAGLWTFLERTGVPDAERLAKSLARSEPWLGWPRDDLPF